MRCPACQRENPPEDRFCGGCGSPLSRSCPSCNAPNPPDDAFCGKCGAQLESAVAEPSHVEPTPAQARDAERRQLTVLFCDLVDSTRLAAGLDPEDWREIVVAYYECAGEVVARFGGHVANHLGDGVLVYFGYPKAHEDDAERAVRAGLGIVDAVGASNDALEKRHGLRLALRVGIHTGLVVVGEMNDGERKETLALGDTTNVTARLQGEAESDTVVMTAATLRLVSGIFVTRDLGERAFKGIAEPMRVIQALRATGVRSRLDLAAATGLTPLVGRQQELALMLERWETVKEGHGQALLLSGEAGMGKSRLVQTLRERRAEEAVSWLECGGSSHHEKSAFHPVIELLEQDLVFEPDDPAETRIQKLKTGLRLLGLADPDALPLLASLLSLPLPEGTAPLALSPQAQRRQTLELLAAWIFALSEQQPLVLVVEDLHWIDPSSLALLDLLIEQVPTARVLLLLTFRPEFEAQWTLHSHLVHLTLHRLSRREVGAMVEGIAGGKALPAVVLDQVVKKTDGVPLFVEELTKSVLESGLLTEGEERYERTDALPELAIPATLQDSLMARLDRLGPAKEVAQLAAVLGRRFSFELLEAVSPLDAAALESRLERLVKAELLYRRGVPPRATYTFKHVLVEDTAYQSLLRRTRQQHHARIARVLEERFPERAASEPETMARHCDEGGLVEKAIDYHYRSGERAADRSANAEAADHLRRAIALVGALEPGPERDRRELSLLLALANLLVAAEGYAVPEVKALCERELELCRGLGLGDPPERLQALSGLSAFHTVGGDLEAASELAEEALALAERTGEAASIALAHGLVGLPLYWRGENRRALEHLDRAFTLGSTTDPSTRRSLLAFASGLNPAVLAGSFGSNALWADGRPDAALERARETVELARRGAHPLDIAFALDFAAETHRVRREPERVRELAEEAVAIAEKHGFPLWLAYGRVLRGWALAHSGGGAPAIEGLQRGLAEAAATGNEAAAPYFLMLLADAQRQLGRDAEARGAVDTGLAISAAKQGACWDADLFRLKAELQLRLEPDALEEAEALLRRALEVARAQAKRSFELRAATSLARLWQRQGKKDEARDVLQPVYDGFTEGFDTQDLKDAKALLEELA